MAFYRYVLCEGRHEVNMDYDGYLFPENVKNPMDFDKLYEQVRKTIPEDCSWLELIITGLTPCVLAVISYCHFNDITVVCLHYNKDTGEYCEQCVF